MTLSRVCVAVSTALWSAKARFDGFVKSTLPYTLPAAQFLNELTSVATPVLALASTSSEPVIADNAMCTALTVGAFCGLNTFFTTQGYQIGVLQRRMLSMLPSSRDQLAAVEAGEARALVNGGESLATFPTVTAVPYRLPPAGIRALALTSGVITVGQWCANNIFLFGEMLKAWSRYRMNLEYAAYVTAAYVLFQLIFDWFSDAMEGVDGLINRAKYDHLVHSMHGCFKAIFGAQSMRTIPRVTGSISQALGRMIPILVFLKPDHLGWEVIIALTVLITIMVGVPVALQAYLFEGKTAIQNMERLANGPTDEERLQRWIESSDKHSDEQEMVSAPPSVPSRGQR